MLINVERIISMLQVCHLLIITWSHISHVQYHVSHLKCQKATSAFYVNLSHLKWSSGKLDGTEAFANQ